MKLVKALYLQQKTTNNLWTCEIDSLSFDVKYINIKGVQYIGTGSTPDVMTCVSSMCENQPIGMCQLAKDTSSSTQCENILIEFGTPRKISGTTYFTFYSSSGNIATCGGSDTAVVIAEFYDETNPFPTKIVHPRPFDEPAGKGRGI